MPWKLDPVAPNTVPTSIESTGGWTDTRTRRYTSGCMGGARTSLVHVLIVAFKPHFRRNDRLPFLAWWKKKCSTCCTSVDSVPLIHVNPDLAHISALSSLDSHTSNPGQLSGIIYHAHMASPRASICTQSPGCWLGMITCPRVVSLPEAEASPGNMDAQVPSMHMRILQGLTSDLQPLLPPKWFICLMQLAGPRSATL